MENRTTHEELEEIRQRCLAASPGLWRPSYGGGDWANRILFIHKADNKYEFSPVFITADTKKEDSIFVIHARTDIPLLLTFIQGLQYRINFLEERSLLPMNRISLEDPSDYLTWREGSGGTVEIFDIAVGSERQKGRGRRLVEILIDRCIPPTCHLVWAITRSTNEGAHIFYEKLGFRRIGSTLEQFYPECDAVMYGRDI